MPNVRKTRANALRSRSLYIHEPPPSSTTAKASTATRSGRVRTVVRNRLVDPEELAHEEPLSDHEVLEQEELNTNEQIYDNVTSPPVAPCPSGIKVKTRAKRYVNSVSFPSFLSLLFTLYSIDCRIIHF
jgi:hypothetical protein